MGKIVGIVAKHAFMASCADTGRGLTIISDEVKQALIDFGMVPIGIVPPKWEISLDKKAPVREHILSPGELSLLEEQLSICSGIVFQGGGNIDDYEYEIARYAYDKDIPTLGVCAGQTVIARALGAEMVDVDREAHKRIYDEYVHGCKVLPGTWLYNCVKTDHMMVNSRHIRAVRDPGDSLTVSAVDEDGNAEVVEAKAKKCYIGIRFHPESLYKNDTKMAAIFENFAHVVNGRSM